MRNNCFSRVKKVFIIPFKTKLKQAKELIKNTFVFKTGFSFFIALFIATFSTVQQISTIIKARFFLPVYFLSNPIQGKI